MTRELIAALLLAVLFSGMLLNIRYNEKLMNGLLGIADDAMAQVRAGNFDAAEALVREASDKWIASDGYTHIMIRHSEIDSATDAFFEFLHDVCEENAGAAEGSYSKLRAHLMSLITMEQISFGSIF